MKVSLFALLVCGLAVSSLSAKEAPGYYYEGTDVGEKIAKLWHPAEADITHLWPSNAIPLKANDKPTSLLLRNREINNVVATDVNDPFFVFFRAKAAGARPVVVVFPGGGYSFLGLNKEGTEVAEWLNSLGFSAAVLLYRTPGQRKGALCDAQRAIRLLRANAARYGIDPDRVGVIGFSAGANLAVTVSTNWRTRPYDRVDAADDFSCRPDFQMPIYPWDLRARKDPSTTKKGWVASLALRSEYPVDDETPPAFIAQSLDDFCEIETSVAYDQALRTAGVSSTMRVYQKGGHGYGLRRMGAPTDVWNSEASSWLARWLKPAKTVLFLGDSVTDRHHIGCTKNYWGFLADRYGFHPQVYGINGEQMRDIPAQADRFAKEHPGVQPDVVFVFAGTNDYNADVPLGRWYDLADEKVNKNGREVVLTKRTHNRNADTLRGRINIAMAHLREIFPRTRFVLMTPLHRGFGRFSEKNVQPDESYSNGCGLFIDDYVEVIKEAGDVWAAKVIDLHSTSGLYPNAKGQTPLFHDAEKDRLHPSAAGHARIAEAIAAEVGDWL